MVTTLVTMVTTLVTMATKATTLEATYFISLAAVKAKMNPRFHVNNQKH